MSTSSRPVLLIAACIWALHTTSELAAEACGCCSSGAQGNINLCCRWPEAWQQGYESLQGQRDMSAYSRREQQGPATLGICQLSATSQCLNFLDRHLLLQDDHSSSELWRCSPEQQLGLRHRHCHGLQVSHVK